jgi:PAS domain S-box-containing protein
LEDRIEEELLRTVALENARSILTARRRAEEQLVAAKEALREGEQRLRAMFAQAAVGIAISELDGRLAETNRKFLHILGYAEGELEGVTAYQISHPDDVATTRANVARLVAGEIPEYSYEKRYLRKDGRTVWTLTSVALLREPDGRPRQFIGVIEDITALKETQEALREESRILELLNRTGAAIGSEVDLRVIVQRVTDAATQISGAKFGAFFYNVSGKEGEAYALFTLSGAPREAFEKFGLPRNTPVFGPTFRGEGVVRSDDITQDPRYGTMAPHRGMPKGHLPVCSYLAVPVVSRSGNVIGGLFFGHPERAVFTERAERLVVGIAAQAAIAIDNARLFEERSHLLERERAARTAAEKMSELKDEFLATLSHELRTPLSAILGWAHVIRTRPMGTDELRRAMEVIERNARAQTRLIEDLLDMSRITSGQIRLDVQPVQPASFIEAAVETVRPAAEAKGIRLEKVLDPQAGPISGDPARLQQVLWNLLSNAIKFTPKGGKVQVVLQRVNSHIEISVADSGIGIRPDFLAHAFDRFRQADGSTTRRHGGLGLGLAIARHLTELHGGTIGVKSAGEGHGATFTIHLPLTAIHRGAAIGERVHPSTSAQSPPATTLPDLTGLTVLAVDDEPDARDLMRHVLEECGAQVLTAGSAEEAIALVERHRPQLLLSDIGMPGADGFDLLRRVRALGLGRGGEIPAIALTAFARAEDRTKVLRAGFRMHVSKPVEAAELCAAVANVAGRAAI